MYFGIGLLVWLEESRDELAVKVDEDAEDRSVVFLEGLDVGHDVFVLGRPVGKPFNDVQNKRHVLERFRLKPIKDDVCAAVSARAAVRAHVIVQLLPPAVRDDLASVLQPVLDDGVRISTLDGGEELVENGNAPLGATILRNLHFAVVEPSLEAGCDSNFDVVDNLNDFRVVGSRHSNR